MLEQRIKDEYFEWMYEKVCTIRSVRGKELYDRFSEGVSFRKLLTRLHDIEFTWIMPMDKNRAEDGIDLRYSFAYEVGYESYMAEYISGPCSVLEMMVALAINIEEDIMDDIRYGDRTGQWFWGMVVSLGLGGMNDHRYDDRLVTDVITDFLRRDYGPDGRGGLFTVRGSDRDLRDMEIHIQRNHYLNTYHLKL
jgi:hypothetical protein